METSLIEKLDKSRYNLVKWFTVGWVIWFGVFISKNLTVNMLILSLLGLVGLIGWILFVINLIKFIKLGKIVNSDSNLKNALSDELTLHNRNKSFVIGYWTLIVLTAIFFSLSLFTNISALIVCEITLYIGVVSTQVSWLIYNRG